MAALPRPMACRCSCKGREWLKEQVEGGLSVLLLDFRLYFDENGADYTVCAEV